MKQRQLNTAFVSLTTCRMLSTAFVAAHCHFTHDGEGVQVDHVNSCHAATYAYEHPHLSVAMLADAGRIDRWPVAVEGHR